MQSDRNLCDDVHNRSAMTLKIFITVNTEKQVVDEVHDALNAFNEVKEIHKIKDGSFQLIAMVLISDLEIYRTFVERLAEIKAITDFESFITASST
ncbi:MAG: Lrp/AsnC ligand binding domain-containing protein [Candidatus Thorarchaeota archaeon]